ncbi:MAG: peptidoglycan-binding domain-containing protein [Bdellovibrio bacteriovorus]
MRGSTGLRGLCLVSALALFSAGAAADPSQDSAVPARDPGRGELTLAAYRSLSASQARNYDRAQDISPRQLTLLLEVSERTGVSLGQMLATGEHESARTWNDHVRPTLKSGNLGSAAGVWQFQPATFHGIIQKYGTKLLALSGTDLALGREPMDLGDGPFTDAEVRALIAETVDGKRGPEDEGLQLLRHNFAVLAFAKHYLSLDSGATTPEEDYLFHFLGAGEGRRVLALARGEARDTLCVKPAEFPSDPMETSTELAAGHPRLALRQAQALARTPPSVAADPASGAAGVPGSAPFRLRLRGEPEPSAVGARITTVESQAGLQSLPRIDLGSAAVPPFSFAPPPAASPWGLPADSPTVTGNPGMFYRDGKGQTQPYTWGEFLENLARRVRAGSQPALVRAKYGVGFTLNGGDLPERAFDPETASQTADFQHRYGRRLRLPEALITGPLNRDETELYKQRLGALVSQGDDEPTEALPPESLSALQHLGLLPPSVEATVASQPEVRRALQGFRALVGKDAPDDPAHTDRLMPAERVALEIYDRRLGHYAGLQACQEASSGDVPDLKRIRKLPVGLQRPTAPHIAAVQNALAAQGLLKQPTEKRVWRDKKRKKHVAYKTVPFAGKVDKATVEALNTFQLRHGLRPTDGLLDAVTLELLGLPSMGPEVFRPLAGPHCAVADPGPSAPSCVTASSSQPRRHFDPSPTPPRPASRLLDLVACPDGVGPEVGGS